MLYLMATASPWKVSKSSWPASGFTWNSKGNSVLPFTVLRPPSAEKKRDSPHARTGGDKFGGRGA